MVERGAGRPTILLLAMVLTFLVLQSCSESATARTELQLAGGEVEASFEFEARDPTTHTFDVGIEMPAGTELEIRFVTTDGIALNIFDPSRAEFCGESNGQLRCLLPFPILEARAPGTWTADVHKISDPPASISISVEWAAIPAEQTG